jgi:hypothetical protein
MESAKGRFRKRRRAKQVHHLEGSLESCAYTKSSSLSTVSSRICAKYCFSLPVESERKGNEIRRFEVSGARMRLAEFVRIGCSRKPWRQLKVTLSRQRDRSPCFVRQKIVSLRLVRSCDSVHVQLSQAFVDENRQIEQQSIGSGFESESRQEHVQPEVVKSLVHNVKRWFRVN